MPPHSDGPSFDRLLLVMPSHHVARKAAEAGVRVWSLWDPRLREADFLPLVAEASEELLFADFSDPRAVRRIVEETARRRRIQQVLHCGTRAVAPAIETAWRLGLTPNPPEAYVRLHVEHETDPHQNELQVQTLTVNGLHQVLGISLRRTSGPPHFTVTGYLHPAPLGLAERARVERTVLTWLDHSGYRFGAAVTQVALTKDGPRIAGCYACPGMDRIPLLTEIASGLDPEAALIAALFGTAVVVPEARQFAEIGFFQLPEGRLEMYTGIENIAVSPWVRGARFPYSVGGRIPPLTDPRSRRGYVVVEGNSPDQTHERIELARSDLIIQVSPPR